VEDVRKGTALIGFNALPGGYREVDVNFSPFINIVTRNYNSPDFAKAIPFLNFQNALPVFLAVK